jgi:hypothetical protein
VVLLNGALTNPRAFRRSAMRIVKANQPRPVRFMQCERVSQAVRSLRRWRHVLYLELQPIALLKMMNAPIEGEQKFKRAVVGDWALSFVILSS